jgi:hypothetical protein
LNTASPEPKPPKPNQPISITHLKKEEYNTAKETHSGGPENDDDTLSEQIVGGGGAKGESECRDEADEGTADEARA